MSRTLIICDVQNDFCEGGSLAIGGGTDVAANISALIASEPDRWDHIVASKDFHIDPGAHFSEAPDFVDSWPPHCVAYSHGSDFHPALDVDRIEATFTKGEHAAAYSGFEGHAAGISLAAWLRMRDVTDIDLVGLATDYCVRSTALDAVHEGFATTVHLDLTAGVSSVTTDLALEDLRRVGAILSGSPIVRTA
jgi:nicotinamidase/pyrazinamidase